MTFRHSHIVLTTQKSHAGNCPTAIRQMTMRMGCLQDEELKDCRKASDSDRKVKRADTLRPQAKHTAPLPWFFSSVFVHKFAAAAYRSKRKPLDCTVTACRQGVDVS